MKTKQFLRLAFSMPIWVIGGLLICLPSYSQERAPDETSNWEVEEFTLPGGTNGNLVTAIKEGPNGYMWFASFAGLHRYDGHEFITYNDVQVDTSGTSTGLTFPNIEHLFWDSQGQLWISTFGGGVFHFDPITEIFTRYQPDPQDSTSINNNFVHYAAEDAEGHIWFATRTGAAKLDRSTGTFKRYKTDPSKPYNHQNNRVRVFYLDKQGTLWATSGEVYAQSLVGGLFRYDPATDTFEGFFPDPETEGGLGYAPIRGMYEDSGGNFWIGTYFGLQKMDRRTGTFTDMPYSANHPHAPDVNNRSDAPIWSFHEDQNKGLWMGTVSFTAHDENLSRYDPINHTTETFPIPTMAWDIAESSDGTIWVAGSAIQGVVHRVSRQKKKYDLQDGEDVVEVLNEMRRVDGLGGGVHVLNINIDAKTNTLWVERAARHEAEGENGWTSTVYLGSKDLNSGKISTYKFDVKSDENNNPNWGPVGLEIDDDGHIWMAIKYSGIVKFNPTTQAFQQFLPAPNDSTTLSSNDIIRMIKDSRGYIWAAGFGKGLNRINIKTGEIKRFNFRGSSSGYDDLLSLNGNLVIALLETRDGTIWVSGAHDVTGDVETFGFLATINPLTEEIKYIDLPSIVDNSYIGSLSEDPVTGNIAFTLKDDGFLVYDINTKEAKHYDSFDGKSPFRSIAGLMFDSEGYLWLSNFNADEFARIDLSNDNIYMFESTLDINSSSNNRHALKTSEGHIIFKNNNGWARIDPDVIAPTEITRASSIKLVDLSVSGESQNYLTHNTIDTIIGVVEHIDLDHTSESFSIRFSDFNYSPIKSSYYYRLYPYEEEFRQSTNEPIADYFKVPPGEYKFQVNASSPKGTIIEPLNIPITIHPPWWKTWWAYALYILGLGMLAWTFYKTQKERTIRIERERGKDRELQQAKEIEKAYAELKSTQDQLIQAEKMASLGELTAGIAHEIQNPLNFVNNFSDVSTELIDEVIEEFTSTPLGELTKDNIEEVKEILGNLKQNLEKISHHGGRASSIVKGMLDHSRAGSDEKVPTDINALCDEYLRLSYHGLRAKDKSFNADFETQFDGGLSMINVVPQDIGRVLLNILNNAFYTVEHKRKSVDGSYKPKVIVTTKALRDAAQIKIEDNGEGMSQEVKDKIFQPFFTTKPTGSGTGLGMSITYDIINNGHGGNIEVSSVAGEGTTFTITIPA